MFRGLKGIGSQISISFTLFASSSPMINSFLFGCERPTHPSSSYLYLTIRHCATRMSSRRRHRHRLRNKNSKYQRPLSQSQIDAVIASLAPRFTSSDLSSVLSNLRDPRLCIPLLHHSTNNRAHLFHSSTAATPFLIAIKRLGAARLYREMDSAASLAFSFPSLPLPEAFFHSLIHFYSEARWFSKAIGVYKRMRSSSAAVRPSTRTFNLLFATLLGHRGANSYVHHLYMNALRSLFRQMLDSGVAPDLFALNAMIKGYVLSLHLNDALRIFHQMVPIYGIEPDKHTYSYLVHGLCAQGRTRNAMELYVEMRGKKLMPSGRACNSLVCALVMAGEVDDAIAAMWEAVFLGRDPDLITCSTMMEELSRQRGVDVATRLLNEMREKEVVDGRCYSELLRVIGEVDGCYDRSEQVCFRR